MTFPFPFENESFYMRPLLIVESVFGTFFTILIYLVIPIVVALALIAACAFLFFAILAAVFGRKDIEVKEKKEKEREQENIEKQGKTDTEISTSLLACTGGSDDTLDLQKRLEIELELLGEMVDARRERLAALNLRKKDLGDEGSDLEVLEKIE
ncbi:uncharacterized protein N7479_001271 [Penicillium vulpinum]|uniref:Uncharacterized protein n=1 Tax=Penicillium vulpinum TaxID=29845 RepID=A0A1V6RZV2_9EURO|nr:uncharacterized protein N7479_001271 [Penicillium vulpinum]KAJ5971353.1 hypothetical protein N7479_001271 [Penicillium vulpinum]OQE07136.1 hypothetical protein PENVUL_c015G05537 [Penicillium vulpinum]